MVKMGWIGDGWCRDHARVLLFIWDQKRSRINRSGSDLLLNPRMSAVSMSLEVWRQFHQWNRQFTCKQGALEPLSTPERVYRRRCRERKLTEYGVYGVGYNHFYFLWPDYGAVITCSQGVNSHLCSAYSHLFPTWHTPVQPIIIPPGIVEMNPNWGWDDRGVWDRL